MKRLALLTFTLVTAVASQARADEKQDLLTRLGELDGAVVYFTEDEGMRAASRFGDDPSKCTEIVQKLADLGVPSTEIVRAHGGKQWPLRKAPEHCKAYAEIHAFVPAIPAIEEAFSDANHLDGAAGGEGVTRFAQFAIESGQKCVKAIDEAAARGAPLDLRIAEVTPGKDQTVTEIRATCEAQIERATKLAGASADADAAGKKAAQARYTKWGAAGDKLEWLLRVDPRGEGKYWALSPRCERTDDAKKQVKAKNLIQWYDNPDGTFTIHKLTFKGNKLVKDQTKSFEKRSQAQAFCK